MTNGFDAKDAGGSTIKIASLSANPFGLTGAQIQGHILIDGSGGNLAVIDTQGAQLVNAKLGGTSTVTSAAGSTSAFTVLASNSARISAKLYNDSTQITYIKFGSGCSTSSYTVQLPASPNGFFEVVDYSGIITGIQASANGNVRVTEITA